MNIIFKLIATLSRVVFTLLILAILAPVVYFAWRASQPMDLPEFKGLTYYQVLDWRKMAHKDYIAKYMRVHPNEKYTGFGDRIDACWGAGQIILALTVPVEMSLWYTFWSWQDDRNRIAMLKASYPVSNEAVTALNFMPNWWLSYEMLVLSNIKYQPHGAVAFCRVSQNIPTPAEFETMKQAHQQLSAKP